MEHTCSLHFVRRQLRGDSGLDKGVITKGVFSLEESLESLKSLDSLESLGNGRILLCFPQSGGSLRSLESQNSLRNGWKMDFSEKTPFPKDPPFLNPIFPSLILLDDRQITHLIAVRLKHLLYDIFRGCFGPSL